MAKVKGGKCSCLMRWCTLAWRVPLSLIAAPSAVRCGDLHGNSNPQTLDSSLRGAAFSSSRVSRPGKRKEILPNRSLPRERGFPPSCLSHFSLVEPCVQLVPTHKWDDVLLPVLSFKGMADQLSQIETSDKKSTFSQGWFLNYSLKSQNTGKQRSTVQFLKWLQCSVIAMVGNNPKTHQC